MLIVTAGRIIRDVTKPALTNGAVLVEAGKVVSVGERADMEKEAGPNATRKDLGTRTLMPGLFDCHVHLGFDGGPTPVARMRRESDTQQVVLMLASARQLLSAGVTTARDLGARGDLALVVQEAIETGMADGPELLVANQPITTTGGHCWFMGGEADGTDEVRRAVRERHKAGANLVKVMSTGGFMTNGSAPWHAQFSSMELFSLVEEAQRLSLPVAAHAHGTPGIKDAVAAGVSTIEHCSWVGRHGMPGEAYAEDVVEALVEAGVRVCATTNHRFDKVAPERFAGRRDAIAMMKEAGVRFIAGTDSGIDNVPHSKYARGLMALELCGLDRSEILAAATLEAADALGLSHRKGSIAPGMDADMIAVGGDPQSDLSALEDVSWVMRGGRAIDLGTLEAS